MPTCASSANNCLAQTTRFFVREIVNLVVVFTLLGVAGQTEMKNGHGWELRTLDGYTADVSYRPRWQAGLFKLRFFGLSRGWQALMRYLPQDRVTKEHDTYSQRFTASAISLGN